MHGASAASAIGMVAGCRYLGGRNGTGAARRGYQLKIT